MYIYLDIYVSGICRIIPDLSLTHTLFLFAITNLIPSSFLIVLVHAWQILLMSGIDRTGVPIRPSA